MTPAELRTAYSYQGAIDLGPHLVEITEELPAHEQTGLLMQLHRLMVELPARVASDLVEGGSSRFTPLYELVAAVDLIDRIYPALDTARLRDTLFELSARLHSDNFSERPGRPAARPADDDDAPLAVPAEAVSPEAAAAVPLTAEPAAPQAAPAFTGPAAEPTPRYEQMAATPEPAPAAEAAGAVAEPAPAAAAPTYVKIDPVSALPVQRVPSPSQGQTIHVQPDSFQ